jgi:copper chaperone CopZ
MVNFKKLLQERSNKMFKNLKSICSILFAIIFVFALSFSTLQACEDDSNCNEPCGSKKCEIKNNNECCLAKKSKQLSTSESSSEQVVLNVKGMTCGGCENRVKGALIECEGVAAVHVSHKDGKAVVQVEKGKVNTQKLIEAVEKIGFSASEG